MLLQHAWLAPPIKPETIQEEDEDEEAVARHAAENDEAAAMRGEAGMLEDGKVYDQEVADWVIEALEKRKRGVLGKSAKPALHAAPLDAMGSPGAPPVAAAEG